ncbi:hypothetical protein OOK31_35945 [Streptomyces sp. NBC_00249]|uniref:hypothetical protein n=1 Tax=Streptomyces sp. NBC_00249 TaxID=2975690 RepID=UPI002258C8B0|nr:hypothetical protein [Streptomyces sp. NBC_00249]MCX5199215.1 hypothetical protein [Streptomyces sp. NBC_00249]
MSTMTDRCPYSVGDHVTGTSYVPPEDRGHEQPEAITGRIVQIGAGWAGVDADRAFVWIRLACGRERKALMKDIDVVPARRGVDGEAAHRRDAQGAVAPTAEACDDTPVVAQPLSP